MNLETLKHMLIMFVVNHLCDGAYLFEIKRRLLNMIGYSLGEDTKVVGPIYCTAQLKTGKNCWLGAGVIVMPGVTIGDNTVIGAGSIVTKDIPSNVVAVGNPCRVLRPVGEHDRQYYYKDKQIPAELFEK